MNIQEELGLVKFVKPEKSLSREEFIDMTALAESLRQYDERRRTLLIQYPETPEEISVQTFLDEIEELSIDRKYGLKALALRFPCLEQQLAELREHGGHPSISLTFDSYLKIIENKLNEIPTPKIQIRRIWHNECPGHPGMSFHTMYNTKRGRTKVQEYPLAKLILFSDATGGVPRGKFNLTAHLHDPIFLHIFGKEIDKLNKYFKTQGFLHQYNVKYDYEQNPLLKDIK